MTTDATMQPTDGYNFIIVEKWHLANGTKLTKAHSCYMTYRGRRHGIVIDYRTRERAEEAMKNLPPWGGPHQCGYAVAEVSV